MNLRRVLKITAIVLVVAAAIIIVKDEVVYQFDPHYYDDYGSGVVDGSCNVSGIILQGDLVTYLSESSEGSYVEASSEDIVYYIEEAESLDDIDAILLEIDSYGGYPVAALEVEQALKEAQKPTVVIIREAGLSASYWAATGADWIIASEISDVGSIGVTMSYVDYSKQNAREGITYNQLSTGKYKDAGDYDKTLTEEEKALFMRDIEIVNEKFINTVAENRGLELTTVRVLADGSSVLGGMALEKGLIDEIGGLPEARAHLAEKIGKEPEICW